MGIREQSVADAVANAEMVTKVCSDVALCRDIVAADQMTRGALSLTDGTANRVKQARKRVIDATALFTAEQLAGLETELAAAEAMAGVYMLSVIFGAQRYGTELHLPDLARNYAVAAIGPLREWLETFERQHTLDRLDPKQGKPKK